MRVSFVLFTAGLLSLFFSVAGAEVILDWNFNEPAGRRLSQTVNEGTESWTNWGADIGDSATTGEGVFRIQRAVGGVSTSAAWVMVPEVAWLVVDLDGWALSEKEGGLNEDIRFGFLQNDNPVNQYAEIFFGRHASTNEVFIHGIAELRSGGAEWIPPVPTGLKNVEERPVRLVLKVDQRELSYSIYYNIDGGGYVHVGTGALDSGRVPYLVRFSALNSFADRLDPDDPASPVEFVDVDRIFLTTVDPVGEDLLPTPVGEVPEEGIVHNWDFDEPEGTTFSVVLNSVGDRNWMSYSRNPADDLGGSATTGDGAFRIRRAAGEPMYNLVYIDRLWAGKQWFVVDFRGWNLVGNANEVLQFGFLHNYTTGPITMAEARLRRVSADDPDHPGADPNDVYLMGRAFEANRGATLIEEKAVFAANQEGPVRIILEFDASEKAYAIYYRIGSGEYVLFGEGKTDIIYGPNALRVYATNIFSGENEFVDIERIFLTTRNPMVAPEGGYDAWVAGYFPEGGADTLAEADPDADGLSNLLEYAFASDPRRSDLEVGPRILSNQEGRRFVFRRNVTAEDLVYYIEGAVDFAEWNVIGTAQGSGEFNLVEGVSIDVVPVGGIEEVSVNVPAMNDHSRYFLRLRVERAE